MAILGLNLNPEGFDPSSALIQNGVLIAAGEEERWTRNKHEPVGVPRFAAAWCLESQGLEPADIEIVAYGWDYAKFIDGNPISEDHDPRSGWKLDGRTPVSANAEHYFCPHHKAHAYGAWAASEYVADIAILVVDGSGEQESASCWVPTDSGRLEQLWSIPLGQSLGFLYEAASMRIGFHRLEGGKTMGLSSYGRSTVDLPSALSAPLQSAQASELDQYLGAHKYWREIFDDFTTFQPRYKTKDSLQATEPEFPKLADFAASVQQRLEQDLYTLVNRAWLDSNKPMNIALSGGVAINCSANGFLHKQMRLQAGAQFLLSIQNPPGDAGVSVGAAVAASVELLDVKPETRGAFLGPVPDESRSIDMARSLGLKTFCITRAEDLLVSILSSDRAVGVCSGKMEFGPRALGNRSLLSRAVSVAGGENMNSLKRREHWRPSAPIIHRHSADNLLRDARPSDGMLFSFDATDVMTASYPAAVHVDGTTRAQVISADHPSEATLHLLDLAKGTFGDDCLLNTSLNVAAPIALDDRQALHILNSTDLQALIIGSTVIYKGSN